MYGRKIMLATLRFTEMDIIDPEQELGNLERILIDVNVEPIQLPYESLRRVTKSFSKVISHGGFGAVYMV